MNQLVQLSELLGNKIICKLLDFFILHSGEEYNQAEIIRKTKLSKVTVIKWLKYLSSFDIVNLRKIGNSNLYALNSENFIVKELKILRTLVSLFDLRELAEKLKLEIYLFGSCARGEDNKKSDIDLLVLGDVKRQEIEKEIIKLSKKLEREIKIQIFSFKEWAMLYKKDPAFYERVEKDKIRIK